MDSAIRDVPGRRANSGVGGDVGHLCPFPGSQNEGSQGELAERLRAEGIQARLTAILESTTDFVSISDLQGRGIYVNEAGRRRRLD